MVVAGSGIGFCGAVVRSFVLQQVTHYYYLTVRFADGTCKKIPVPLSTYNRSREDKPCIFVMQKGFFGFRVVKSAKTP